MSNRKYLFFIRHYALFPASRRKMTLARAFSVCCRRIDRPTKSNIVNANGGVHIQLRYLRRKEKKSKEIRDQNRRIDSIFTGKP
jgi:hypothetical protein